MKSAISKPAFVACMTVAIVFCAIRSAFAQSQGSANLNENAFALATRLINEGHVIADGKGAWSKHRPSADQENEFIRLHGFSEYAKWHLGIDARYPVNTKRRYKFPYGDFNSAHRCGLLAAKARARQNGYVEIEKAAAELLQMISPAKPSRSGAHNSPLQSSDSTQLETRR
jgi:hypothetical protein